MVIAMQNSSPSGQTPKDATEVLIVGAGAAGAYLAARFAGAGKDVTVLDAGPAWELADLVSNQIWARRLRWGGAPVLPGGAHPFAHNFNAGWGFGGAALHHYGTWPRMHEDDFRMRTKFSRGHDWPISYQDLRPFYDEIQERAGVSGDAAEEVWRGDGAAYPLPALPVLDQAQLVKRGFDALGVKTAPAPMAILSRPYKDRQACIFDGWCDAGCPIGALYNPLVVDIPEAKAAGAAFFSNSTVTRITSEGDKATGVEYVGGNGETKTIKSDIVILAASVVHNPALLLNSPSNTFPDGLGNTHGLVGAYFMSHALAPIYGMFEEETFPHLGVSGAQLISHDDYAKDRGQDAPFGSYQWLIAPAMKPNDLLGVSTTRADLFGNDLHDFMQRATRHIGNMIGFAEETPRAENRIELSDQHHENGSRLARIVHSFDENTLALREAMRMQGEEIMKAAGANETWSAPLAQAHMMGGTIMGDDPATSVTNSYGRSHAIGNLVIAGSGLYPTSGAVNPTFTLYALAARTVSHMLDNWADYAG